MNPDRFTRHGPEAYGIEANVGVALRRCDQQLIVIPRAHPDSPEPPPARFPMPPLPARLVEDKVRLLRRLASFGRLALWALYLDVLAPHEWRPYLPPQWCGGRGVRANLSYPKVVVPGAQLRLAGTLQSALFAPPDELMSNLPPFDGVHVYFHPVESWLLLTAYLTIAGETYLVMPQQVIADPPDPELGTLSERLWGEE